MATLEKATFRAMTSILNLVSGLRMRVDFKKSWCWSTTKTFQTFWHHASQLLMDPTFQFTVKNHVQDLGCMISYTAQTPLGPLRDKVDNAIAKCNPLKKLSLSLHQRAEKIQIAIWPALFYGTLGLAIGDKQLAILRRAAAAS